MSILPIISAFCMDTRTLTLALLIVVDLVVGIIAALRSGTFRWAAVGQFYKTNVVPYGLGYALVYAVGALGVGALLGATWEDVAQTVGAGPAVISLVASIGSNLGEIRGPQPVKPQP